MKKLFFGITLVAVIVAISVYAWTVEDRWPVSSCVDSDITLGFNTSGNIKTNETINGTSYNFTYWDYCVGDVIHEYGCNPSGGEAGRISEDCTMIGHTTCSLGRCTS